ncbi:hypothetical protein ANCCAN_03066 [Ancylostoma caninum]|uniref:Uncharacterized protein n=1 Tax=Ancylostoma caninum TaxID=29170 RepID=A0A368H519_ANCCA|nr:hypothetical protein ANCCAN_03066 [Ancylostoma caninum]
MQGYMGDPEQTSKVIDADGWFHTGDIGMLDNAGQTLIVERPKVAPAEEKGKNSVKVEVERSRRRLL